RPIVQDTNPPRNSRASPTKGASLMCGIAGAWFLRPNPHEDMETQGRLMGAALRHRGPDAEGVWMDAAHGICFVSRRLAILDLSEDGSQPMVSQCGRYVLAYNGECYNFKELRALLISEGCVFRSTSDTEVIVEACARWGFRNALKRFNGMFAFALWDRHA